MREFLNTNDDAMFDRLADNELSVEERRALLESLDARPDGWRRCAIAFLEAQSWGNDFRQIVREPVQSENAIAMPLAGRVPQHVSMRRALGWAAIAASLLVAFSIGVMQRDTIAPTNGASIANAPPDGLPSDQLADALPKQPVIKTIGDPDALTLWVRDEAGQPRSVRVPLMDADALDRELGVQFRSGMPSQVRSRLQDRGYQVESKRRYAPLWLENGQRMVLPVEDTRIVPVNENVY